MAGEKKSERGIRIAIDVRILHFHTVRSIFINMGISVAAHSRIVSAIQARAKCQTTS